MKSKLKFITEVDSNGDPLSYGIYGDVFDHETQKFFPVAEHTFKFNRAVHSLEHYKQYFNVVDISFETREQF